MKSFQLVSAVTSFVITYCLVRLAKVDTEQFKLRSPRSSKSRTVPKKDQPLLTEGDRSRSNADSRFKEVRRASSKNSECSHFETDWSKHVRPKYELDSAKFLVPTLINGPNNQMLGFQQSILLSLLLNRTLVLPLFYYHEIDNFFRSIVPHEFRLNIQKLRNFMSVIPMQRALRLCNYKLDAILAERFFNLKKKGTAKLVRFSMETGFRVVDFADDVGDEEIAKLKEYLYSKGDIPIEAKLQNMRWWPANKKAQDWTLKIIKTGRHKLIPILPKINGSSDVADIRSIYSTDAKCVLHWFPFRRYRFQTSREVANVDLHRFTREDGWKLYSDIILNTLPPDKIYEWSKQFQNKFLCNSKGNYISMHWRFDDKDFFDFICHGGSRKKICDNVKQATNITAVAKAILILIADQWDGRLQHARIVAIYIAAPPTLKHFIREIAAMFMNVEFVRNFLPSVLPIPRIFTAIQLKDFLQKNYKDCAMAKPRQLLDTISQIEMDICARGYAFLWSRQSTWSSNARLKRSMYYKTSNFDYPLPDYVLQKMNHSVRSQMKLGHS